eukprot:5748816-Heterocapsa_arctica.AAC.1
MEPITEASQAYGRFLIDERLDDKMFDVDQMKLVPDGVYDPVNESPVNEWLGNDGMTQDPNVEVVDGSPRGTVPTSIYDDPAL